MTSVVLRRGRGGVNVVGCVVLVVVVLVRRTGRRAWPGAALALVAAVSFLDSHIYWPRGVVTVLVLGAGLVLLERARAGSRTPAGHAERASTSA